MRESNIIAANALNYIRKFNKMKEKQTHSNQETIHIEFDDNTRIGVGLENEDAYFLKAVVAKDPTKTTELLLREIKPVFQFLDFNSSETAELLEVDRSTLSRWDGKKPIGKFRSKAVIELDSIIGKGIHLFGSQENFKQWMNTPNLAFGNKKPNELIKDPSGMELVHDALEALSWGNVM